MPCRSICCAGHDDSSRDMLNGNGFATSRSPMSFEVFDIERGRWDSMLNWRTKVVVDFGSEATSSEEIVPAGLAPHYANPTAATDLVAATSDGLRTE